MAGLFATGTIKVGVQNAGNNSVLNSGNINSSGSVIIGSNNTVSNHQSTSTLVDSRTINNRLEFGNGQQNTVDLDSKIPSAISQSLEAAKSSVILKGDVKYSIDGLFPGRSDTGTILRLEGIYNKFNATDLTSKTYPINDYTQYMKSEYGRDGFIETGLMTYQAPGLHNKADLTIVKFQSATTADSFYKSKIEQIIQKGGYSKDEAPAHSNCYLAYYPSIGGIAGSSLICEKVNIYYSIEFNFTDDISVESLTHLSNLSTIVSKKIAETSIA